MAATPPERKRARAAVATEEDDALAIFVSILLPLDAWLRLLPPDMWTYEIAPKIWGQKRDFCAFRATCRGFRLLAGQRWLGDLVRTREWKAPGRVLHSLGSWCGRLVTGHFGGAIRMWTSDFRPARKVLRGHTDHVTQLVEWQGLLASSGNDNWIGLWNEAGKCVRILKGHMGHVLCLLVWGDYLVSSAMDDAVRLWDFATGTSIAILRDVHGSSWVTKLVVFGDYLVGYTTARVLLFWDARHSLVRTVSLNHELLGHEIQNLVVWNGYLAVGLYVGIWLYSASGEFVRSIRFTGTGLIKSFAALGPNLMVVSTSGSIAVVDTDYTKIVTDFVRGGNSSVLTTVGTSFVVSRGNRLFLFEQRLSPPALCFPL